MNEVIILQLPKPRDAAGGEGTDWTGFTFSCTTKTHWVQSPGGRAGLLLEFPCASCLLSASLEEQSSLQHRGVFFQDVGIRPEFQPRDPPVGVSKSCSVSVTWKNVEGKRGKISLQNAKGKREKEKTPKFGFCDELKLPVQTIWCLSPSQTWPFRD